MKLPDAQTRSLNQRAILLRHMEKIGAITKLQALNYYGIMNVGAIIGELIQLLAGKRMKITTVMFEVPSGKRVAKYFLVKC